MFDLCTATLSSRLKWFILWWLCTSDVQKVATASGLSFHTSEETTWRFSSREMTINTHLIFYCFKSFSPYQKNSSCHSHMHFLCTCTNVLSPCPKLCLQLQYLHWLPYQRKHTFVCLDSVILICFHTVNSSSQAFSQAPPESILLQVNKNKIKPNKKINHCLHWQAIYRI